MCNFNALEYFLRYNELKKIDNELQRALEKLQQDLDLLMTQKMAFEEELNMSQVCIYLFCCTIISVLFNNGTFLFCDYIILIYRVRILANFLLFHTAQTQPGCN